MDARPSSAATRALIRSLSSTDRSKVQAAKARLTLLGGRAVDPLIETLEGGNDRVKLQAMPMLALIRDGRAREPLLALLHDRDTKIREAACRALSRFPSRETIQALEKVVQGELRAEVRAAAIQALASIFEDGFDEALPELLNAIFDAHETRRVRLTAVAAIPQLGSRDRRTLLKRLRNDPDRAIALRARWLERELGRTTPAPCDENAIGRLTMELSSSHYDTWNDALRRLIALGPRALPQLVTAMRSRHRDPEFASRAAMALKGLGPRHLRPVADYLDIVVEPLPLEVLVDVVASLDDRPMIYKLREFLESLDGRGSSIGDFAGPDPYARVRAKAHLAIARLGSRVAIADLRRTMSDPSRRIEPELLAALGRIGTREELPHLLSAYRREDSWMRGKIREVFWYVVRREKIRRGGPSFQSLAREHKESLREILQDRRRDGPVDRVLPGLSSHAARFRAASAAGLRRRTSSSRPRVR